MVGFDKLAALLRQQPSRIVFSRSTDKQNKQNKLTIRRLEHAKAPYQAERYTDDKVFHTAVWDLVAYVQDQLPFWRELHLLGKEDYSVLLSKGAIVNIKKLPTAHGDRAEEHNRNKHYAIPQGEPLPIFVKLGIFTQDYKVVNDKQDKFRQVNRYLEMLEDAIQDYHAGDSLYCVDFGCGKSYLSFAVYYYLTVKKKLHVHLTGIDLKADVIAECQNLADQYGYDGMDFVCGNIKDFVPQGTIDLVISLHACDIATDYVLYGAIANRAKHIFSVPCCQHQVNRQLDSDCNPLLLRYGILRERYAAMLTDAIRCTVLELADYKVDLLEFVDLTDSPKNLLIRAKQTRHTAEYKQQRYNQLQELLQQTNAHPTLLDLVGDTIVPQNQ